LNVGEASFGLDIPRHITKLLQNLVNGPCNPKPPQKNSEIGQQFVHGKFPSFAIFFSKKHYAIKDLFFLLKSSNFLCKTSKHHHVSTHYSNK
jgi:hypothetical protein